MEKTFSRLTAPVLTLRQVHTTSAYWFFVLSAVHLGIFWKRLAGMVTMIVPICQKICLQRYLKWVMGLVIVIAGIYASFARTKIEGKNEDIAFFSGAAKSGEKIENA